MQHEVRKATRRYVTLLEEAKVKGDKLTELRELPLGHVVPEIQGQIVAYEAMVAWFYDEIQAAERDLHQLRPNA